MVAASTTVVLAHDRPVELHNCLTAIFKQDKPFSEVIVHLDQPFDPAVEHVVRRFDVKTVSFEVEPCSPTSIRLSKIRNLCLAEASGASISFVDDDVELSRGFHHTLSRLLEEGFDAAHCGRFVLDAALQVSFEDTHYWAKAGHAQDLFSDGIARGLCASGAPLVFDRLPGPRAQFGFVDTNCWLFSTEKFRDIKWPEDPVVSPHDAREFRSEDDWLAGAMASSTLKVARTVEPLVYYWLGGRSQQD